MPTLKFAQVVQACFLTLLLSTGVVVTLGQTQLGFSEVDEATADETSTQVAPAPPGSAIESAATEDETPAKTSDAADGADASAKSETVTENLSPEDYEGGWRQAGEDADGLGATLRQQVLYLTPEGNARGRISLINPVTKDLVPADDAVITLLDADGNTAFEATVEDTGVFRLQNVPEGVFSLIVTGPSTFMAFAIQTLRVDDAAVETEWTFDGAAVPRRDFPAVLAILSTFEQRDLRRVDLVEPDVDEIPADALPNRGRGEDDTFDPSTLGTPIFHHPVYLQPDGRLLGRLRRLQDESGRSINAPRLKVHAIRNGEVEETAMTNSLGTFTFQALSPAAYSIIAEGEDGFLAFAVDVRPTQAPLAARGSQGEYINVALRLDESGLEIDAAVIPKSNVVEVRKLLEDEEPDTPEPPPIVENPPYQPYGTPGQPGGTGGGGGGVGGGSGIGEILAIAAIAALVSEIDKDKQPASPGQP